MSVKIAYYANIELQLKEQEKATSPAHLDALAAEAAAQLESARQMQVSSESKVAAATARVLELEQELIVLREQCAQQKREREGLQQQLVDMENCLGQQRQDYEEQHRQPSVNRNTSEGNAFDRHHLTPVRASSPLQEDQLESAAGGVGSRWSLVMKEQLRQQQHRLHNQRIGERGAGLSEKSPLSSPSTFEQLSAAAATITMHNEQILQLRQECENLQAQLSMMQTRAEASEARLQQMSTSSSSLSPQSTLPPATNLTPQRVAPSFSTGAGTVDFFASEGSNLLQLSQLTAQVVLDCRRMTEVNHASLREIQVAKSRNLAY
jgi:hypothetical protein